VVVVEAVGGASLSATST